MSSLCSVGIRSWIMASPPLACCIFLHRGGRCPKSDCQSKEAALCWMGVVTGHFHEFKCMGISGDLCLRYPPCLGVSFQGCPQSDMRVFLRLLLCMAHRSCKRVGACGITWIQSRMSAVRCRG